MLSVFWYVDNILTCCPYLIFVRGTRGGARGEKNCHVEKFVHMTDCQVEKFSTWQIVRWRNSPHDRLSCGKNSPHEKCEENLKCGEIMCTIYGVLSHFTIFCCKISIFAIYAVCREICFGTIYALLRGEKLSQKLGPWRKNDKYEVWCCQHGLKKWFCLREPDFPGVFFSWIYCSIFPNLPGVYLPGYFSESPGVFFRIIKLN